MKEFTTGKNHRQKNYLFKDVILSRREVTTNSLTQLKKIDIFLL